MSARNHVDHDGGSDSDDFVDHADDNARAAHAHRLLQSISEILSPEQRVPHQEGSPGRDPAANTEAAAAGATTVVNVAPASTRGGAASASDLEMTEINRIASLHTPPAKMEEAASNSRGGDEAAQPALTALEHLTRLMEATSSETLAVAVSPQEAEGPSDATREVGELPDGPAINLNDYIEGSPEPFYRSEKCRIVGGAAALVIGIVLMCILIPLSAVGVERQHFAFRWNKRSTVDTKTVYGSGVHWWGPSYKAIAYPSTYHRHCFDQDRDLLIAVEGGQVIEIDLCFHFALKKDSLSMIFRSFGQNYQRAIAAIARNAITNTAPSFSLNDYVNRRENVTAGFYAAIVRELEAASINVTVPTWGVFLGYIELPDPVLDRNREIFFNTELMVRNTNAKAAKIQRLVTNTSVLLVQSNATRLQAEAQAVKDRMKATAALRGTSQLRSQVGAVLVDMARRLNMTTRIGVQQLAQYSLFLAALDGSSTIIKTSADGGSASPRRNWTIIDTAATAVIPSLFVTTTP
jgi:hypothetical protein